MQNSTQPYVAVKIKSEHSMYLTMNLRESSEMAKKRQSPADKFKTLSAQVGSLPKLLKISLVIAIMGTGLSCTSICLQVYNARLLRRVETRHHSCIKRIMNSKVLGGASGLNNVKRSLVGQVEGEADESDQRQCRYRQKTDWMYYYSDSVETAGKITVDFHAAEVSLKIDLLQVSLAAETGAGIKARETCNTWQPVSLAGQDSVQSASL